MPSPARRSPRRSSRWDTRDGLVWREAFGHLTYDPEAAACTESTIFDLASLTKVIATTTVVMRLVDEGVLRLDDRVGEWLSDWKGKDRDHVTLRDLLAHCSGLSAHLPLYESYSGRREFQRVICGLILEYTPRTQSIYSDMGFMLLGWIARRRRRRVALRTACPARAAARAGVPRIFAGALAAAGDCADGDRYVARTIADRRSARSELLGAQW